MDENQMTPEAIAALGVDPTYSPKDHFTNHYVNNSSDSFPGSRISLARRLRSTVNQTPPSNCELILDLGSGPQTCVDQYIRAYGRPNFGFVTLDFSDIDKNKLLRKDTPKVSHIQATGEQVPLQDSSFAGVISNLSLDVMKRCTPDQPCCHTGQPCAIHELARVIKPGGFALVNLNLPDAFMTISTSRLMHKRDQGNKEKSNYELWKYLAVNQLLFTDKDQILDEFQRHGLNSAGGVKIGEKRFESWWEIDLVKQE